MPNATSMTDYYQERAPEYEQFYHRPERQADQADMKVWLEQETQGRTILEVACGTGYWTAVAAPGAQLIHATDVNTAPMEIACSKNLGGHVSFIRADAYQLPDFDIAFDCGMAHFWWSHVPLSRRAEFLAQLASRLERGAKVLMIDNNQVEGSTIPLARRDDEGNTYQTRKLSNGNEYEVIKNFSTTADLEDSFFPLCVDVQVKQTEYFWGVRAVLK